MVYMRRFGLFILILAMVSAFAGCQPTPDKPVVVQKNMEQMIGQARETPPTTPETANHSLAERLGAPESLRMELVSAQGKLKVHVDAVVTVPDVPAMPTVRVGMGAFTSEDVMRLYETLCGDAMPVDPYDTQTTQAFKMRTIQDLMDQKDSGKLDMKYESMEDLDAAIAQTMQEAAGLPEHFTPIEPDLSFVPRDGGTAAVNLRVAPDDATLSDLYIYNAEEGVGFSRAEYYRDLFYTADLSCILNGGTFISVKETESPYFVPPAISEADAGTLAEDTITALGLSDFVCSGSRLNALYNVMVDAEDAKREGVYEFMFTRQIAGVAITYTNDEGNQSENDNKDDPDEAFYAMPWLYEKVHVIIDDGGVLCLVWNSPYVVTDTVAEDTAMLPFKDIQNTFESMITVVNNRYDTSENGVSCDMYITEVRLGLMRVREENGESTGLVIPVWDFFGYFKESDGIEIGRDGYNALLTANAINGSVVDRGLGY